MRFYWRWAWGWTAGHRRPLAEGITLCLLERMDDAPRLDAAQRSWLLKDFQEDLACQIDAEGRVVTERGAKELVNTRAITLWLEMATIARQLSDKERWQRDAYLAANGDLGGEAETAFGLWRDDPDERARALLDFQGRKLRGRMEELGRSIGELGERSRIDTVSLVAILEGRSVPRTHREGRRC